MLFRVWEKWLPQIITKEGWEGPESGELTKWTKLLRKQSREIPESATCKVAGSDWKQALAGCNQLRHTAVHRLKITAKRILNLLDHASTLAKTLDDARRSSWIETIRDRLESNIDDIIRNKHLLESKLSDELQVLAKGRAELDQLERIAVENMTKSDKIYLAVVGSGLEDLLMQLDRGSDDASGDIEEGIPEEDELSSELEDNETCSEHQSAAEGSPHIATEIHLPANEPYSPEKMSLAPEDNILRGPSRTGKATLAEDAAVAGEATLIEVSPSTAEAAPVQEPLLVEESVPAEDITLAEESSWAKKAAPADEAALTEESSSVEKPLLATDSGLTEGHALPEEAALAEETINVHKASFGDQTFPSSEVLVEITEQEAPEPAALARQAEQAGLPMEVDLPQDAPAGTSLPETIYSRQANPLKESFLAEQSSLANLPKKKRKKLARKLARDLLAFQEANASEKADIFREALTLKEAAGIHATSSMDESSSETCTISLKIILDGQTFQTLLVLKETTRDAIYRQSQAYLESKDLQTDDAERAWRYTLRSIVLDGCEVDLSVYDANDLTFLLSTIGNSSIPKLTVEANYVAQ